MKTLKFKIYDYNVDVKTAVISFCSDESKGTPDDYPKYNYQPANLSEDDPDLVLKEIVAFGSSIAVKQDEIEKLGTNSEIDKSFKSMIGKVTTVDL